MAKAKKVLSTVLAALMVVFTVAGYVPAKAAVVPQIKIVEQPQAEYKVGERMYTKVQCANFSGKVEYRATLWDGSEKKTIEVWKTYPYYYKNWQPTGKTVFPITWIVEKPGVYNLTVYVRPVGSKVPYSTYAKSANFTVKSADVTVDSIAPVADVTVNEGEKVTLPEKVTLNMSDKTTKEAKVTWAAVDTTKVGEATVEGTVEGTDKKATVKVVVKAVDLKVESVSANNLKEVEVKFTKKVDPNTAEDDSNYTIYGKTIESATLSEDGKTVTLVVAGDPALENQTEYQLTFNNVREASGSKIVSAYKYKFTPVDAQLPVPEKVEALGNKTIKVTFNEPVKNPTSSSFLIDGKVMLGYSNVVGRTAIVKVYSPLSNGEHKITIKDVYDYSKLKSLSKEMPFTVVEDTTAPTVSSVVKATFETVVLQFSEPVDPATVKGSNVYWMQGTVKKPAAYTAVQLSDDTFAFDFSANKVQYTTDIYVTGVKDYSGNTIAANTKITATPVLDTTRPEVINAELQSLNEITVKFSERLQQASAEKAANYVVKDSKGNVVCKLKTAKLGTDGKTVTIKLTQALSEGETYTFEISGVADNTTLNNVMLPYTTTFNTDDETNPTVSSVTYNSALGANTIIVTFSEPMATSGDGSIVETGKYMYKLGGTWKTLPSSVSFNVSPDGCSILITFPSTISVSSIEDFRIQLVKDLADNYLAGLTKDWGKPDSAANPTILDAQAKGTTTICVFFNRDLQANTIDANDFDVISGGIKLDVVGAAQLAPSVPYVVVLTLAENSELNENGTYGANLPVSVVVKPNATTSTADGKTIVGTYAVSDKISATVKGIKGSTDGKSVTVEFNEALLPVPAANTQDLANIATDFVIYNDGGKLLDSKAYSIAEIKDKDTKVTINFTDVQTGIMSISIANPRFLKDAIGNVVAPMNETEVVSDGTAPLATIPTATGAGNSATELIITFNEALYVDGTAIADNEDVTKLFAYSGAAANYTKAVYDATAHTVTFTFTAAEDTKTITVASGKTITDKEGNAYSAETYKYTATGTLWSK